MRTLLFFFLAFSVAASAQQKKVADLCSQKKTAFDSSLLVEYGPALYPYFVIDSAVSGIGTFLSKFHAWNDSVDEASVYSQRICYNFHFPGAMKDRHPLAPPVYGGTNTLLTDTIPFCTSASVISAQQMDRIVRRKLRQPLSECTVRPFRGDEWLDKKHNAVNWHQHAFLLVSHTRSKSAPFGGWNRIHRSIVIDATTGKMIGRMVKTKGVVCAGKFD